LSYVDEIRSVDRFVFVEFLSSDLKTPQTHTHIYVRHLKCRLKCLCCATCFV